MSERKNTIIGVSVGYQWNALWPFVVSARLHAPDAKLVILSGNHTPDTLHQLEEHGVCVVPISPDVPYMPHYMNERAHLAKWRLPAMHIVSSRFAMQYVYLTVHGHECENVMLIDVRDALIAADPFDYAWDPDRVSLIRECERMTIGSCPYNGPGVNRIYDGETLKQMADRSILCSGVMLGRVGPLRKFLAAMLGEFAKFHPNQMLDDQVVANYIAATEPDLVREHASEATPIYHTGYFTRDALDCTGKAVIHQYDRFPDLATGLIAKHTGGAA